MGREKNIENDPIAFEAQKFSFPQENNRNGDIYIYICINIYIYI